ncbi:hypothetical protein Tco_1421046 [Tanacetum coccineum]
MVPINRLEDQVVIGETSLSFALDVAHSLMQRLKWDVVACRLSLTDVMVLLLEPLSVRSLTGEASTSMVPSTAVTTALSTTFVQASTIPPIPSTEVPLSPKIVFEEELDTVPELRIFQVHGRCFPLWSMSLYAPLPSASVTSYGPSHFGLSFSLSFAWLASLLRYTRSRLISKASSFYTMSISAILKVGIPIFAGMTTSVPYVSENGVSPLLDLILCASVCSFHQAIGLWEFDESKALADA